MLDHSLQILQERLALSSELNSSLVHRASSEVQLVVLIGPLTDRHQLMFLKLSVVQRHNPQSFVGVQLQVVDLESGVWSGTDFDDCLHLAD